MNNNFERFNSSAGAGLLAGTDEKPTIYGPYKAQMEAVISNLVSRFEAIDNVYYENNDEHVFEHISYRIKSDESMREKCRSRDLPETAHSALKVLTDAIGIRIITSFVDDIYGIIDKIREFPDCSIITEKDYIKKAKSNGYRSYHLILNIRTDTADVDGNIPGEYFVEIQLRTIAMDTWASLEHKMKYKKDIPNQELISSELKRVADELASCDMSMQTIRAMLRKSQN